MVLQKTIQLRMFLLLGFAVVSGSIMLIRLFHLQVVAGFQYLTLVDDNRFFTVTMPKERGILQDRYGNQLVFNEAVYWQGSNPDRLYDARTAVSREQALPLMATDSAQIIVDSTRWYPLGGAGAHIIGYTGPVTAEDIERNPSLRANEVIGKFGLERGYDEMLTGVNSKEIYEITALGKKNRLLRTELGKPGSSVTTTLDPFLMTVAAEAMGDQTGAVVIQDAQTGGILALISTPNFDPNIMSKRESDPDKEKERRKLVSDFFTHPKQLFFNRAIGGAYPPGSVFKLVTATAGLESGKFDANTTVVDEGVLKVGEYSYGNWYFSQYGRTEGTVNLRKAISRSNDIYFYKAAEWMGPEKLAEFARLFGYGSKTGIELPGESAGFVPSPSWKEEVQGERWFLGNTYHFGIGQGDILVTPLQVSQMTQSIVNHGTACPPFLLAMDAQQCRSLGLTEENLELVVDGMIDACSAGGTAYPFFEWNTKQMEGNPAVAEASAYQRLQESLVACKTGTAEFGINTNLNKKKTHAWFTMALNTSSLLGSQVASSGAATVASDEAATGVTSLSSAASDLATPVLTAEESLAASRSATAALRAESHVPNYSDHATWLKELQKMDFPETIVITVLVESDEANLYREGSKDAAPVAKAIVDWMSGKPVRAAVPVVPPPPGVAAE